jgi:uncharacterized Zn finger protein
LPIRPVAGIEVHAIVNALIDTSPDIVATLKGTVAEAKASPRN